MAMGKMKRFGRKKKIATVRLVAPRKRVSQKQPNGILSKSMKGKLIYSQAHEGFIGVDQIYRLNSIFDPDLTNLGHQPYGRDTYATLYNRYRVDSVSYVIDFACTGSTGQVVILPTNTATSIGSFGLAREHARAVWKSAAQYQNQRITGSIDLAKLNGVPKKTYQADDRFQSLMGTNPAEIMCMHILAGNLADVYTTEIYYTVTLTYHCTFYDPIELSQS